MAGCWAVVGAEADPALGQLAPCSSLGPHSGPQPPQGLFLTATPPGKASLFGGQHFSTYPTWPISVGLSAAFRRGFVFFLGVFTFPNISPFLL